MPGSPPQEIWTVWTLKPDCPATKLNRIVCGNSQFDDDAMNDVADEAETEPGHGPGATTYGKADNSVTAAGVA